MITRPTVEQTAGEDSHLVTDDTGDHATRAVRHPVVA
jgi:hypothetical protein